MWHMLNHERGWWKEADRQRKSGHLASLLFAPIHTLLKAFCLGHDLHQVSCSLFLTHVFHICGGNFHFRSQQPNYGLTNVIWISWIRSTFKYLQYIFLLSITFNTGQPWDVYAAKYILPAREILIQSRQKNCQFLDPICDVFDSIQL